MRTKRCSSLLFFLLNCFTQQQQTAALIPCGICDLVLRRASQRAQGIARSSYAQLQQSFRDDKDYFDNDDDNEYDDDDEPPDVDVSNFRPPTASFGFNKGRSSPSQRKAMGRSVSGPARIHICSVCGSESVKWMGRCPTCKEWNTLQEHVVARQHSSSSRAVFGSHPRPRSHSSWLDNLDGINGLLPNVPVRVTDLIQEETFKKRKRRIVIPQDHELNTVLGGGIMKGSLILIGGDPGVGKSTLLLQTAASVASMSTPTPGIGMGLAESKQSGDKDTDDDIGPVWYVSGEENPDQIASRASRLGIRESELWLLSETHADVLCENIIQHISKSTVLIGTDNHADSSPRNRAPALLVIDSIQTMICDAGGTSAAGGVTQVRECAAMFLRLAKSTGIPVMLVGHVTKSGDVAGPRTVEHMVDCVLYLEGSEEGGAASNLRVLRASKNRFGSSDEVGVYEMTAGRLLPVSDPSSLFLAHRNSQEDSEGCAIAIALEGMRAMTVEVQALATSSGGASKFGRRTVEGIANSRLMLLIGVLQKRCGLFFSNQDVYVNVVGRMRLDRGEGNSADLAVAVALVSSLTSIEVRADTAFVGEVGLRGELRSVPALEKRIQEAGRMGFSRVVTPIDRLDVSKHSFSQNKVRSSRMNGIEWIQCDSLMEAISQGLVRPVPKKSRAKSVKQAFPNSLQELGLEEIMDDKDDEYNPRYGV